MTARKGNWRDFVKIGSLVSIAAVTLLLLASDLSSRSRQYEDDAAYHSRQYDAESIEQIAKRCVPLAPRDQYDCIQKAKQVARENQRAEQDLAAQKVTAWWTTVMGVAALIGMGLSAVGVVLVWTTFRETRRSADVAREQANLAYAQADPYIELQMALYVSAETTASAQLYISVEAINRGLTEARQVRIDNLAITTSDGTFNGLALEHAMEAPAVRDVAPQQTCSPFQFTSESFRFDIDTVKSGGLNGVWVKLEVRFSYLKFSSARYFEEGVWNGMLEPTMRQSSPDQMESLRIHSFSRSS